MKLRFTTSAYSIFFSCLLLMAAGSCDDKGSLKGGYADKRFPNRNAYNDRARYIAGLDVDEASSLYKMSADADYKKYKKDISALWDTNDKKNLKKIEEWRPQHLKISGKRLFYPFSGPDILNALAFFPDAEDIIMIGLESPGAIPDPGSMKKADSIKSLWNVKKALRTILNLNLFRTLEMASDLRYESLSNITGIMMFFLVKYNCEILDIERVILSDNGQNIPIQTDYQKGDIRGVRIIFRKTGDDKIRSAVYYSFDLSDGSFNTNKKFKGMLGRFTDFTALIKSASYLMHNDSFSGIRNFILDKSLAFVQCDSGIPYKYIDKKKWDISLYGRYRVLEMFKTKNQKDLAADMKTKSKGALPFSYGYGFLPEKSHVIIAVKK